MSFLLDRRVRSSKTDYFLSLSLELKAQAARVRQLIGDAHWGHDGRHKEILFQDIVRRHSPASLLVTTGFVVSPVDIDIRSTEQDVLVVDTSLEAPLFHNGDLSIVFPHTVVAAISIKSSMRGDTIESVVHGLNSVRKVARDAQVDPRSIWCGGFFYDVDPRLVNRPSEVYRYLREYMLKYPIQTPILHSPHAHIFGPDLMTDPNDLAYLIDYEQKDSAYLATIRGHACNGGATAVFLSCLLEHYSNRLRNSHSFFSDAVSELNVLQLEPPEASFKFTDQGD